MEIHPQITKGSALSKMTTDINDTRDIFIKAIYRVSKNFILSDESFFSNEKGIRLDEFLDALIIERNLMGEKPILKYRKRYKSH